MRQRTPEHGFVASGIRKNIYLRRDEAEALRWKAFNDRRSEAAIVRDALRAFLELGEPEDPEQD